MAEPAAGGSGPDEQADAARGASDQGASNQGASDQGASDQGAVGRSAAGPGGVWGAATDPVGTPPPGARPIRELPVREVTAGEPGGRPAARSRDSGREASRDSSRDSGRVQGRAARSRKPEAGGPDLLNDLQRWLLRSSAKSMRREIEGQVRRSLGSGRREPGDVWGTATTEPPSDAAEAPECAWCPICRAARRMRENGPGLTSQITGVSEAVAAAVQDAIGAFDGVLSRTAAAPAKERPADRSPRPGPADSAHGAAERAADEPGDRS